MENKNLFKGTVTITFGEVVENHVNMEEIGEKRDDALNTPFSEFINVVSKNVKIEDNNLIFRTDEYGDRIIFLSFGVKEGEPNEYNTMTNVKPAKR